MEDTAQNKVEVDFWQRRSQGVTLWSQLLWSWIWTMDLVAVEARVGMAAE